MRFGETVKLVRDDLVVSRRHEEWVTKHDAHPVYNKAAMDFAAHQLNAPDRDRMGTVSASGLGECQRAQQFVYLGMPKLPPDAKNAAKMQNGAFMHLRWQMEGLSEGWLSRAEVPVHSEKWHLQGTMDGLLYEGSILELKSINANGFSRVQTFGPLVPHLFQMATYMLCTDRTKGVFIYECKDNQEYTEIVVTRDDVDVDRAAYTAVAMQEQLASQELAEPLNDCLDRKGWRYESCPFRDRCLAIHRWEEVADVVG